MTHGQNILPVPGEYCTVGGVNGLGGRLTHGGDDGRTTVGQALEAGQAGEYRGSIST